MTNTPEHDKVDALKSHFELAGDLAYLLLDSEHWQLVNSRAAEPIVIPVQKIIAELIGIDFEAYQAERVALMGLSGATLGVVTKVLSWSQEPAAAPIDAYLTPAVIDPLSTTPEEANLIAAIAQAEDVELSADPVAFVPEDDTALAGTEDLSEFDSPDPLPGLIEGLANGEGELIASVVGGLPEGEVAAYESVFADEAPAVVEGDDTTPKTGFIETGNYQLFKE